MGSEPEKKNEAMANSPASTIASRVEDEEASYFPEKSLFTKDQQKELTSVIYMMTQSAVKADSLKAGNLKTPNSFASALKELFPETGDLSYDTMIEKIRELKKANSAQLRALTESGNKLPKGVKDFLVGFTKLTNLQQKLLDGLFQSRRQSQPTNGYPVMQPEKKTADRLLETDSNSASSQDPTKEWLKKIDLPENKTSTAPITDQAVNPLICRICGYEFSTRDRLFKHIQLTGHRVPRWGLKGSENFLPTPLQGHEAEFAGGPKPQSQPESQSEAKLQPEQPAVSRGNVLYKCDQCKAIFDSHNNLHRHVRAERHGAKGSRKGFGPPVSMPVPLAMLRQSFSKGSRGTGRARGRARTTFTYTFNNPPPSVNLLD
ncbi:MAG: hypothetical protein M1814_004708 [Vezdaea aestivalis]|nr:MAG: hypothetical protein M1814_004708 [Vezdaea aestivalis]